MAWGRSDRTYEVSQRASGSRRDPQSVIAEIAARFCLPGDHVVMRGWVGSRSTRGIGLGSVAVRLRSSGHAVQCLLSPSPGSAIGGTTSPRLAKRISWLSPPPRRPFRRKPCKFEICEHVVRALPRSSTSGMRADVSVKGWPIATNRGRAPPRPEANNLRVHQWPALAISYRADCPDRRTAPRTSVVKAEVPCPEWHRRHHYGHASYMNEIV